MHTGICETELLHCLDSFGTETSANVCRHHQNRPWDFLWRCICASNLIHMFENKDKTCTASVFAGTTLAIRPLSQPSRTSSAAETIPLDYLIRGRTIAPWIKRETHAISVIYPITSIHLVGTKEDTTVQNECWIKGCKYNWVHVARTWLLRYDLKCLCWFNSLRPSDAHMRRWTGSSLVQIMACRLFGAKPLFAPMLEYC